MDVPAVGYRLMGYRLMGYRLMGQRSMGYRLMRYRGSKTFAVTNPYSDKAHRHGSPPDSESRLRGPTLPFSDLARFLVSGNGGSSCRGSPHLALSVPW
jgi:hypothetical protein